MFYHRNGMQLGTCGVNTHAHTEKNMDMFQKG